MPRKKPQASKDSPTMNKASDAKMDSSEGLGINASATMTRAALAHALGFSFNGERDLYHVLGYKQTLTYKDYRDRYERADIAKRLIDAPVNATWRGVPEITENQEEETDFDLAWIELAERLKIWNRFTRVDKLTGLGRYGILLLGFNDTTTAEDFKKEAASSESMELLYTQPFSEGSVTIKQWSTDVADERYGLPLIYEVDQSSGADEGVGDSSPITSKTLQVHWTRLIHIVDDCTESDVYGTPRLKAVFNRLQDLDKIVGGSAEMFWKGARPGYQAIIDSDAKMSPQDKEDISDQMKEYEHNLRRMLRLQGVKMEGLETQVSSPTPFIDGELKIIAAAKGYPMRILTGSERGELASTQDDTHWREVIEERRSDFAEPMIVRALIDRLIELQVLPEPDEGYTVVWTDLHTISDKDKADIGRLQTEALAKYASSPGAEFILPPDIFLETIMGFDKKQIEKIKDVLDTFMEEEETDIEKEERLRQEEIDNATPTEGE